MSGAQTNPRRRPFKDTDSRPAPLRTHNMRLRKSETFTSPKALSNDLVGLDNLPFMPRRSPTSTQSLEQMVDAYDYGRDSNSQRIADILKNFSDDGTFTGRKRTAADNLNDREVSPLPNFLLRHTSMAPMEIDCKPSVEERNDHEHASDSGLGSSLSDSRHDEHPSTSTSVTTPSAITQSVSAYNERKDTGHVLSEYAREVIEKSILDPLHDDDSVKDFHPLINQFYPKLTKTINTLRDLERMLIHLAPNYSATSTSYFNFCVQAVGLMETAVQRLPERDQTRPADPTYTNLYFLDLMQQIRRYAEIMVATKAKEAKGQTLDDMDYSRDEKIVLRGGLSVNGRPAEFVREKADGQVIPLADSASKRVLSDDDLDIDDEAARRSMARRRKSEKPGDVVHMCGECKKEFKRPCDLTKHEKTHSRPWKCSESSCKYHKLGWPTEKECQRHWNDKHSNAPASHRCLFHTEGCTYTSKRESNCKQHMEKAHGWHYQRSKSNGRKKAQATANGKQPMPPTPPTPFLGTPATPAFATPGTPFTVSPYVPMHDFNPTFGFGTPALSAQDDFRRDSLTTTEGSIFTHSSNPSPIEPSSFENAVSPDDLTFNHSNMLNGGANMDFNFQQPTPAMSTGFDNFNATGFSVDNIMSNTMSAGIPHMSPGAQDVTLYTPAGMHLDEGFNEPMQPQLNQPTGDFTLYDASLSNMDCTGGDFFPDLNQLGGQFGGNQLDSNFNSNTTNLFGDQGIANLTSDNSYASLFGDQTMGNSSFDDMLTNNFIP